MNKIILFSNIKGGVGKTSCCALFAQYLHEKGYPVTVLDADIQASLLRHRERELSATPDASVPWAVSALRTADRKPSNMLWIASGHRKTSFWLTCLEH